MAVTAAPAPEAFEPAAYKERVLKKRQGTALSQRGAPRCLLGLGSEVSFGAEAQKGLCTLAFLSSPQPRSSGTQRARRGKRGLR